MGGIATSVHDTCISIQIEREKLMRVFGDKDMLENFDFGGMSGGPVLAIVQTPTLRSWIPAGVIFQGPNPAGDPAEAIQGLEIIRARPVHFINPDAASRLSAAGASLPGDGAGVAGSPVTTGGGRASSPAPITVPAARAEKRRPAGLHTAVNTNARCPRW